MVEDIHANQFEFSHAKMKIYLTIVLFLALFAIISEALFFGVPRSSCSYDYQCRKTGKCVGKGNAFCGISSK